jgi:hypothetical protein
LKRWADPVFQGFIVNGQGSGSLQYPPAMMLSQEMGLLKKA